MVGSGNGKGQVFVKGKVVKTVPEHRIVETLIEEATRIAGAAGSAPARVERVGLAADDPPAHPRSDHAPPDRHDRRRVPRLPGRVEVR